MDQFEQVLWRFVATITSDSRSQLASLRFESAVKWLCCAGRALWSTATVQPAWGPPGDFFSSPGFLALCAFAASYVIWLRYAWRVKCMSRQIRCELSPQLSKREKLVSEPRDFLLQGMIGLLLRFQIISDHLTLEQKTGMALDDDIDRGGDTIVQRNDSHGSPGSQTGHDLPGLLLNLADELAAGPPVDVYMTVEGMSRNIQPAAKDAIRRIATEALSNSYRHAQAEKIEICVVYHRRQLVVQLRDDGVGLDQVELDRRGSTRRSGLLGMQARARLLGGEYSIFSRPNAGTVIQFSLPPKVAYYVAPGRAA